MPGSIYYPAGHGNITFIIHNMTGLHTLTCSLASQAPASAIQQVQILEHPFYSLHYNNVTSSTDKMKDYYTLHLY